jgi:predicted 2-oxoglutarate/Fe(II)-dependent dioxygenase YbiX
MIVLPALPVRNRNVAMIHQGQHFSREECEKIRATIDPNGWSEGLVGGRGAGGNPGVERKARSVLEQRLKFDQASSYPLSKILKLICDINSSAWYFDLSGFAYDDMPYVMRYNASRADHYDWHTDMGQFYAASRKLSFSLQLSDGAAYDGGDLEFYNTTVEKSLFRALGTLIVFPAYWMHRVHPVTRGQRDAVVGWVHGPSYR